MSAYHLGSRLRKGLTIHREEGSLEIPNQAASTEDPLYEPLLVKGCDEHDESPQSLLGSDDADSSIEAIPVV